MKNQEKDIRHENSEKGEKRLRENGRKEREELEERSRNWNCKKEMVQRHKPN